MTKIQKLIKHDRYVEQLCKRIESDYDLLLRKIPLYSKRNRLIAEIDVMGIKDDSLDIFEVKCSHRITKARKQLTKIRRILSARSSVRNSFFFCGESGIIMTI